MNPWEQISERLRCFTASQRREVWARVELLDLNPKQWPSCLLEALNQEMDIQAGITPPRPTPSRTEANSQRRREKRHRRMLVNPRAYTRYAGKPTKTHTIRTWCLAQTRPFTVPEVRDALSVSQQFAGTVVLEMMRADGLLEVIGRRGVAKVYRVKAETKSA